MPSGLVYIRRNAMELRACIRRADSLFAKCIECNRREPPVSGDQESKTLSFPILYPEVVNDAVRSGVPERTLHELAFSR
jgi:hypothetical protein